MKRFKNAWFCVSCHGELTHNTVMYSHGRCPLCGHKGISASTIVDTYEKAVEVDTVLPVDVGICKVAVGICIYTAVVLFILVCIATYFK